MLKTSILIFILESGFYNLLKISFFMFNLEFRFRLNLKKIRFIILQFLEIWFLTWLLQLEFYLVSLISLEHVFCKRCTFYPNLNFKHGFFFWHLTLNMFTGGQNDFLEKVKYHFKGNKTISDGGITIDFWIIKVHTSNWSSNSWESSNSWHR